DTVEGGRAMSRRSPRSVIGAGIMGVAVAAAVAVVVASSRPQPPPPPKFPRAPEAHPVIPPEAVDDQPAARPAPAFCEARDTALVDTALGAAHQTALTTAQD